MTEIFAILTVIFCCVLLGATVVLSLLLLHLRQKMKVILRENNNFKTLCDIIPNPIWFKDKDLKLTWVNEFYSMMFDRDREQLYGLTDRDIAPKKLVDGYVRDDEYVLQTKKAYKYRENEKAGLWYETIKFPLLNKKGDLYGLGGVAFNITAIKKSEMMLHNLVHNDYLTGISNRLFLSVEVTKKLTRAHEGHYKLAVILLDLDNFKDLNDIHGHVVGDAILKEIASRLKRFVQDARDEVLLGRFGGDEFVIVLPEIHSDNEVMHSCERIREILKHKYQVYGGNFVVEASMGIGVYPDNSSDYEGLVRHADMALFYAKQHGRNNIVQYSDSIGSANLKRIRIESHLKGAIEHGEFYLYFQPKVTADGTALCGVETLLRWNNVDLGFVSPGEFIPVAEQSDMIVEIGDWVLRNAMLQNLQWKSKYGRMQNIAVNLSVKQIRQPDFLPKLLNLLDELNYPPECLELELTEGMLMDSSVDTHGYFEKLRTIGVRISIDDFGTGYSNLGYLSNFPLDNLKIDRRFVTDIYEIPEKQQIAKAIIQLARAFNLTIIAEGVETKKELDYLRINGVDVIQGFFYSRPLPPDEVFKFEQAIKDGLYVQAPLK